MVMWAYLIGDDYDPCSAQVYTLNFFLLKIYVKLE